MTFQIHLFPLNQNFWVSQWNKASCSWVCDPIGRVKTSNFSLLIPFPIRMPIVIIEGQVSRQRSSMLSVLSEFCIRKPLLSSRTLRFEFFRRFVYSLLQTKYCESVFHKWNENVYQILYLTIILFIPLMFTLFITYRVISGSQVTYRNWPRVSCQGHKNVTAEKRLILIEPN